MGEVFVNRLKFHTAVTALDVNPSGDLLATGGTKRLSLWNWADLQKGVSLSPAQTFPSQITQHCSVSFDSSGTYLACAGDEFINLYIVATWKRQTFVQPEIFSLAWCPESTLFACGSATGAVKVWCAMQGAQIHEFQCRSGFVKGLAWDPVGSYLALQTDSTFELIRTHTCPTGEPWTVAYQNDKLAPIQNSTLWLRLAFNPAGTYLAVPNCYLANQAVTTLCKVDRLQQQLIVDTQLRVPSLLSVSSWGPVTFKQANSDSSDVLVTGSTTGELIVWQAGKAKPVLMLQDFFTTAIADVAWHPRGTDFVVCSQYGEYCCLICIPEKLFGKRVSHEVTQEQKSLRYGASSGLHLLENPEALVSKPEQQTNTTQPQPQRAILVNQPAVKRRRTCVDTAAQTDDLPVQQVTVQATPLPTSNSKCQPTEITVMLTIKPALAVTATPKGTSSSVVARRDSTVAWTTQLPKPCTCGTGNSAFVAIAALTELYILSSTSGRLLCPPILVPTSTQFLSCNEDSTLLCVTESLQCICWDVLHLTQVFHASAAHLCTAAPLASVFVNKHGICSLYRADGTVFAYHTGMECWVQLSHSTTLSDYTFDPTVTVAGEPAVTELYTQLIKGNSKDELVTHQEQSLLRQTVLFQEQEYVQWLKSYIQLLLQLNDVSRLRDVCLELLGVGAAGSILPHNHRHTLAERVMADLKANASTQRLAEELYQISHHC